MNDQLKAILEANRLVNTCLVQSKPLKYKIPDKHLPVKVNENGIWRFFVDVLFMKYQFSTISIIIGIENKPKLLVMGRNFNEIDDQVKAHCQKSGDTNLYVLEVYIHLDKDEDDDI